MHNKAAIKSQSYLTRFIVVCHARTGSTLFGSLLNSHPAIAWGGEEFNRHRKQHGAGRLIYHWGRRYPIPRLNWLAWRQRGKIYGCKLAPEYVRDLRGMILQLDRQGWLIIHLRRKNKFQEALSRLLAHDTQRYQHFADQPRVGPSVPSVTVKPVRLVRRLRAVEETDRIEAQALADTPHLQICYEDDLLNSANWEATMGHVFAALGLAPVPLQSNVKKTWDRPYSELITNYAELVETARTAGYSRFLESTP